MDLDPPAEADMPPFGLAGSSLPDPQPSLANPADSPGLSLDRRPKKSSTTCAVCRFRKVRCNGARPCCGNCQRLGFPCSYDEADVDAWSLSLPRRRVKQACLSCHSRKARCSGHIPSCERCRVQGIDCVYRPSKRAKPSSVGAGMGSKSPNSPDRESDRDGGRESRSHGENRDHDDGRNESPALTDPASSASPGPDNHEGYVPVGELRHTCKTMDGCANLEFTGLMWMKTSTPSLVVHSTSSSVTFTTWPCSPSCIALL